MEEDIYKILDELNITYNLIKHNAVYTVEEAEKELPNLSGNHCKNLFLRNKKGNKYYLVICDANTKVDLKELTKKLNEDRLGFASEERLEKVLKVKSGSVSPFNLINDEGREVNVIIDVTLKDKKIVNFHPNINTRTVQISYNDLKKFINNCGNYNIEMNL